MDERTRNTDDELAPSIKARQRTGKRKSQEKPQQRKNRGFDRAETFVEFRMPSAGLVSDAVPALKADKHGQEQGQRCQENGGGGTHGRGDMRGRRRSVPPRALSTATNTAASMTKPTTKLPAFSNTRPYPSRKASMNG